MKDVTARQPRTHVPKSLAAYRTLLRLRPRVLAILVSRPSAVTTSMAPASPPDDVRELRRGSVPGEGGAVVVHQGLHGAVRPCKADKVCVARGLQDIVRIHDTEVRAVDNRASPVHDRRTLQPFNRPHACGSHHTT